MSTTPPKLDARSWQRENNLLVGAIIVMVLFVMIFSASNINSSTQIAVASVAVGVLLVLRHFRSDETVRIIFLLIAAFLSVDYFFWRTFHTLTYYDFVSFSCAIILYIAEVYGFIVYALSIFVNIDPLDRKPLPPPEEKAEWPTVDVMIPTYNEDKELLEITLLSALQLRYPKDKLNVYLLDDGGTDQRCDSPDPDRASAARKRRAELKKLCQETGAHYLTRERNVHAKAGNINNGLQFSNGELVLILDADHVPTVDFLENTIGWFVKDPKLFLVQTPHFFTNPDPIEKNLMTFDRMPSESEMFYKVIQKGLDFWNSAFFCGSAAVLRRSCLREVGGIAGDTITEDAETALTLHAKGYNSAYIDRPMISGLSPETLGGFIGQRIRWAQGMVQIFLLKNPLLIPGLTLPQRLCYFSSCFFWFFAYARLVFILAPLAFLFFGLKIYDSNFLDFCAFALPHLFTVFLVSDFLFGKVRWSFVSELYELIQSVYVLPAIIKVFMNPRAPTFNVTAKGETLNKDFVSPLSKPFYILTALNLIAVAFGVYRLIINPVDRFPAAVTLFWAVFNVFILICCLGALLERRQRRTHARTGCSLVGKVILPKHTLDATVTDLSNGGACLVMDRLVEPLIAQGDLIEVKAFGPHGHEESFQMEVRNLRTKPDRLFVGVQFHPRSVEETRRKITFVNGNSERWINFQQRREERIGVFRSLIFLLGCGVRYSVEHLGHILLSSIQRNPSSSLNPSTSGRAN